jgi:hypothetical protein
MGTLVFILLLFALALLFAAALGVAHSRVQLLPAALFLVLLAYLLRLWPP